MTADIFLIDPRYADFVAGESAYLNDLRLSWRKTLVGSQRSTRRVYEIQLRYVFEPPAGEKIEDRLTRSRPDLRNQSLPEPGTPIKVLYVNRRLYRMM